MLSRAVTIQTELLGDCSTREGTAPSVWNMMRDFPFFFYFYFSKNSLLLISCSLPQYNTACYVYKVFNIRVLALYSSDILYMYSAHLTTIYKCGRNARIHKNFFRVHCKSKNHYIILSQHNLLIYLHIRFKCRRIQKSLLSRS